MNLYLNLKDTISNNVNQLLNKTLPSSANLKQQATIDNALINAGLPENKINSINEMSKDQLRCDNRECLQRHVNSADANTWTMANQHYKYEPEDVKLTKQNYYEFDSVYPEKLTEGYTNNTIAQQLIERLNKENNTLNSKTQDFEAYTYTNGRKVVYEDRSRDWLMTIWNVLLFFYFIALAYYIVFGSFIPDNDYMDWTVWFYILLYILFPFVLNRLVNLLFYSINYIKSWSFLIKNVYTVLPDQCNPPAPPEPPLTGAICGAGTTLNNATNTCQPTLVG